LNEFIERCIKTMYTKADAHFIPMSEYIMPIKKHVNILRFESLSDDFNKFIAKYKLTHIPKDILKTTHRNKSPRAESISDISPENMELINEAYRDDFINFGYDMIDPS